MAKVLVAEDDKVSRKLLCECVKSMGHEVVACSDGDTAWKVLECNPDTAVIITDMQMPGITGRELIEKLRSDLLLSTIPVIIISGAVTLKEIKDLLAHGASYFMPKPMVREHLVEYVTRLMEAKANIKAASH